MKENFVSNLLSCDIYLTKKLPTFMRNLLSIFILLSICSFLFVGCKSDSVSPTNNKSIKLGQYEIYKTDLVGSKTLSSGTSECSSLGSGYHVPTQSELQFMYDNMDVIGGFDTKGENPDYGSSYISSTTRNNSVYPNNPQLFVMSFYKGGTGWRTSWGDLPNYKGGCRCIRFAN